MTRWTLFLFLFASLCLPPSDQSEAWTHGSPPAVAITFNIVTDFGASCSGATETTATLTIAGGSTALSSATPLWVPGDATKAIEFDIPNVGTHQTTISVVTDSQHVTLTAAAPIPGLSAQSVNVAWGVDDAQKFADFNTAALAWQAAHAPGLIELDLPAGGRTCPFLSALGKFWTFGIKKMRVVMNGATITNGGTGDPGFFLGGAGIDVDTLSGGLPANSSPTATVTAGSSCVTLSTPAQASRFSVGDLSEMSGYDQQGIFLSSFGSPPNWAFFEYVQIASSNAGTGQVCFAAPLKYGYKSTWPLYDAREGGPATLWVLPSSWNTEQEFIGGTISQTHQNTYARGRLIKFTSITFPGAVGWTPSQNGTAICDGCAYDTSNSDIEVDKLISSLTFRNSPLHKISFQSANDVFVFDNSSTTEFMAGTAKNTTITNSSIAKMNPGPLTYGFSNLSISNTAIPFWQLGGYTVSGAGFNANGGPPNGVQNDFTMSGGVIFVPITNGAQNWAIPGANLFWAGQYSVESQAFQVTDVDVDNAWPPPDHQTATAILTIASGSKDLTSGTALWSAGDLNKALIVVGAGNGGGRLLTKISSFVSSTHVTTQVSATTTLSGVSTQVEWGTSNTRIHTSLAGGFPSLPLGAGSQLGIRMHPAPIFTCATCTGSPESLAYSLAPAGTPLYSFWSQTYNGSLGTTAQPTIEQWGNWTSVGMNVTATFSGAASSFFLSQFNNWDLIKSDNSVASWNSAASGLAVDAKIAGNRVVTRSGVTCNGLAGTCGGGDAGLSAPDATLSLFTGMSHSGPAYFPSASASCPGAGCPSVTLTIQTDQGVVNYLLKRDLDPASNDNTPMWLDKAA